MSRLTNTTTEALVVPLLGITVAPGQTIEVANDLSFGASFAPEVVAPAPVVAPSAEVIA